MAKSYVVGSELFRTQKELRNYIQGILHKSPLNTPLDARLTTFLLALLEYHPTGKEKQGAGVQAIVVRTNPVYRHQRNFWLIRVDGTETDFSYTKCLQPPTARGLFHSACRAAIKPQMESFRREFFSQESAPKCPVTSSPLTFGKAHVDHKAPLTFEALVDDFVSQNNINVDTVELIAQDGLIGRELPEELRLSFSEYHQKRAVLWMVSPEANLGVLRRKTGKQQ